MNVSDPARTVAPSDAVCRGTCASRAPVATPKDIVAKLSSEMIKIVQAADFKKRMAEIGAEPIGHSPEQMAQQIKDDTEKFARLVKQANVVIE